MKGVKGKFLKKLKTIKTIGYLKPDRILLVNAADGFIDSLLPKSITHLVKKEGNQEEEEKKEMMKESVSVQEPEIIDVTELMKDLEDDEGSGSDDGMNDKENVRPELKENEPVAAPNPKPQILSSKISAANPLSEIDISSFRPPDLDSGTLFDPNLLAAFEQAVMEVKAQEAERRNSVFQEIEELEEEPPLKSRKIEEEIANPLSDFKEICPPGGSNSVILYTTGLRGIRKTFEDCTSIRFLLESFRVLYHERDLSMHSGFRDELWRILGGKVVPPRLFIKGRYIGGAEEVLRLHEQGRFRPLFAGIPVDRSDGPCRGCAGVRFVVCFSCSGSRKVDSGDGEVTEKCSECNENGLVICPICC